MWSFDEPEPEYLLAALFTTNLRVIGEGFFICILLPIPVPITCACSLPAGTPLAATMGVFGGLVGWLLFKGCRKIGLSLFISGLAAGFLGDLSVYFGTSHTVGFGNTWRHFTLEGFPDGIRSFSTNLLLITVMEKGASQNRMVVRLHTGDPSIYGAIREQMDELDKKNIEYEYICIRSKL